MEGSSCSHRVAVTEDALFDGALRFRQLRDGYRVSVDTVFLAAFAAEAFVTGIARVVDLGAGVGGVTLVLHHFVPVKRADLVELEPSLAALAEENLASRVPGFAVHRADLARGLPRSLRGVARAVVCNPPYFDPARGRPRASDLARGARSGDVEPFARATAGALGRRARAFFVYPAQSLAALLDTAGHHGLVAKRLRLVHPFGDAPARVALVEFARAKPGGLVVEPPLIEWAASGVRSPEVTALLAGRAGDRTRLPRQRGR